MPIVLVLTLSTLLFVAAKGNRILLTLAAVDAGAGPLENGILFALYGLFPFLLAIYAGRIADRFSNLLLVYIGTAGFVLSQLIPAVWHSLAALYLASACGGLTSMLFVLAFQNMAGMLSTPATRATYFSYYALGESFAHGMGPILTGLSIDTFNAWNTFFIIAAFTALWLPVTYYFRRLFPQAAAAPNPAGQDKRSLRELLALPAMRMALLTNAAVMLGFDLFNLYMPLYGHSLGFSATTIGLIIGAYGLAAFITRLLLPMALKRLGEPRVLILSLAVPAACFLLVPLTAHPLLLMAIAFVIGFGLGCGQPLSMMLAFNAAPAGRSAEAIAMRLAVSYGAHVFLPPLFGAVGTVAGLAPVFWVCGVLLGAGSAIHRKPAS
jgi:MFS family permease